jgi:8-oxo-dGTP diphosphatase
MIPSDETLTPKNRDLVTLTTDILVFNPETTDILLIERTKPPFMNKLVLPGGHVENDDGEIKVSCAREAEEEVGLKVDSDLLDLFDILYGDENRDPRVKRSVSIVYIYIADQEEMQSCVAGSDAKAIQIKNLFQIKEDEIGFDHWQCISKLANEMIDININE